MIDAPRTSPRSTTLTIVTFGGLAIARDGAPVTGLASRKAEALLVYLACEPGAHPRDVLADMLWDDVSTERARGNLSVLLTSLRQQLGDHLTIDRQRVALNRAAALELDCAALAAAIDAAAEQRASGEIGATAAQALDGALASHRGEFLEGFAIRESVGFERWMVDQQDRWRQRAIAARELLAGHYLARRQIAAGLEQVTAMLAADPLHDEAHRLTIELLAASGQRAAALAHYQSYVVLVASELGIAPYPAVAAAHAQLLQTPLAALPAMVRGAPTPATRFVGQEREIERMIEQLLRPDCRLLTLLGPGGIGKTRSAIEVARRCAGQFASGAIFVALAEIERDDELLSAIADACGLASGGAGGHLEQLQAFVRERELLLVLDNLEQLKRGFDLVGDLLANAPRLTILATSRERLQLQGEWLFDLRGMTYPAADTPDAMASEEFSALALFSQTARRVRPDVDLSGEQWRAAGGICRLVEGSPLAIELAAAWTRSMPCVAILAQIGRSFDLLTTTLRDVPSRHRSMRAVFASSWEMLDAPERAALAAVTVFRGGFTFAAAEAALCGAGDALLATPHGLLAALAGLIDRSLLRQHVGGRYDLHELVRQYAAEQLEARDDRGAALRARHSDYFAQLVAQQADALATMAQPTAAAAIDAEIENIGAAWDIACARARWRTAGSMIAGLTRHDDIRGHFAQGYARYAAAEAQLAALPREVATDSMRARLLTDMALLGERMGRYDEGERCAGLAIALCDELGDTLGGATALILRSRIAERRGRYAAALESCQVALDALRAIGDRAGIASALHGIGSAQEGRREYAEGQAALTECLALRRELGEGRGLALSINLLGVNTEMLGDLPEAMRLYEQSVRLFEALHERWAILFPLSNLGDVAATCGDTRAAHAYYARAIRLAQEIGGTQQLMMLLVKLAALVARDDPERAIELLATPLTHPATEQAFRAMGEDLLARCAADIGTAADAALDRGRLGGVAAALAAIDLAVAWAPPPGARVLV